MAKANGKALKHPKEFFETAIPKLKTPGYKGCHLIYSGLHGLIGEYYGLDKAGVRAFVDKAVAEGIVAGHPVKGGYMVYLPQDAPAKGTGTLNGKAKEVLDALRK